MTVPPKPASGGIRILGSLSPVTRIAVIGTVAVALVAIIRDFVVHVDLALVPRHVLDLLEARRHLTSSSPAWPPTGGTIAISAAFASSSQG